MAENIEETLLKETEYAWNEAILKQDVEAAAKFLAEDYVLVGIWLTRSGIVARHLWLNDLATMHIHTYQTQVVRTRLYGDSGAVSVVGSWHVIFDGREILENLFLTDVWSACSDGWKVVLRHCSRYPQHPRF
jgi:ketosteroid isomerase-like protein